MYGNNNKLSVKVQDRLTDPFTPKIGVRQGDVLSPNIFKIFINDFSTILEKYPVNLAGKKITSLLYVDDLVLISNSAEGLQHKLDIVQTGV